MICSYGDVVVVPFPFVDLQVAKGRPALVLSSREFNASNGQTILAMITTAARSSWASDHPIADPASCGLKHASVVRWKVFTLTNDLVLKQVGAMVVADRDAVAERTRRFLAVA